MARLDEWTKTGGDLHELLGGWTRRQIKDPEEAYAVCNAIVAIRQNPGLADDSTIAKPLHTFVNYFRFVKSIEAVDVFTHDGLPLLRELVGEALDAPEDRVIDSLLIMDILQVMAMYRQEDDIAIVAAAARKPLDPTSPMWWGVFNQFDEEHPLSLDIVDALRTPLPQQFIAIAYLDMANRLAISGRLFDHPFNNSEGIEQLQRWLLGADKKEYSFAQSATKTLPFIDEHPRALLLDLAALHPAAEVRLEASMSQARMNDEHGVQRLIEMCLRPEISPMAQAYMNELGLGGDIPEACHEPEFQALAEMAGWLAHPMEFGRPPDKVELYDARTLYWPKVKQPLRLLLIAYEYNGADSEEPQSGVGMVGSETFAVPDAKPGMPPEDIYALYCCWELGMHGEANVSKQHYIETGRKLLRKHNDGF